MKQTKQQETENITDTKVAGQEPDAVTSGGIGYSGTIKVTVKRGKHTVSSKIYHNTGTPKLFEFMANVLAGRYSMVSSGRPQRLMLFQRTGGTAITCLSGPIIYSTTPYVQELKTDATTPGSVPETIGSAVILHFVIPGTLFAQNEYDGAALYDATGSPGFIEGESNITYWPDPNCYAYFTFAGDPLDIDEGETAIID